MVRSQAERLDMLSANALRLLGTAPVAILIPFFLGPIGEPVAPSRWAWVYIVLGTTLTMAVGDLIFYISQNILGVSRAQPISNTYPIVTMLLAAVFLHDKPTWTLGTAIVPVIVGAYLLIPKKETEAAKNPARPAANPLLGLGLAVGAALAWGAGTTLFQQGLTGMDVLTANQIRVPAVALIVVAMLPFTGRSLRLYRYGWRSVWVMATVGIMSLGVGSIFFLYCIQTAGATKAAIIQSVSPLFAAPIAIVFLKERLTWRTAGGILLCMAAVWLVLL